MASQSGSEPGTPPQSDLEEVEVASEASPRMPGLHLSSPPSPSRRRAPARAVPGWRGRSGGEPLDLDSLRPEDVLVNIYDIDDPEIAARAGMRKGRDCVEALLSGASYAGIEVYGFEWGYNFTEEDETGISRVPPRRNKNHVYRATFEMGLCSLREEEVDALLERMAISWRGPEYHLVHNNCLDFGDSFCEALGVGRLPRPKGGQMRRSERAVGSCSTKAWRQNAGSCSLNWNLPGIQEGFAQWSRNLLAAVGLGAGDDQENRNPQRQRPAEGSTPFAACSTVACGTENGGDVSVRSRSTAAALAKRDVHSSQQPAPASSQRTPPADHALEEDDEDGLPLGAEANQALQPGIQVDMEAELELEVAVEFSEKRQAGWDPLHSARRAQAARQGAEALADAAEGVQIESTLGPRAEELQVLPRAWALLPSVATWRHGAAPLWRGLPAGPAAIQKDCVAEEEILCSSQAHLRVDVLPSKRPCLWKLLPSVATWRQPAISGCCMTVLAENGTSATGLDDDQEVQKLTESQRVEVKDLSLYKPGACWHLLPSVATWRQPHVSKVCISR
eukprot:TRINITY_DN10810_c0_g1_i1.p1 TRINITY_DN10810_c0_g1~~TRINITY_DN10810_c0_g1_i1.p1  ORF type:complete len:562 (+),score=126.95 TRINITY_DN10810_c0_g1_i1:94-1779(+)